MVLDVDYRLMADNLLDLSHVNFLHDGLLGHSGWSTPRSRSRRRATRWLVTLYRTTNVAPPKLFDLMYRNDGEPVDTWAEMRWNAPGCLRNHAGVCPPGRAPRRRDDRDRHAPAHADQRDAVRYHIAAVQLGGLPPGDTEAEVAEQLSRLRRFAFEEQDRPMVEAQQRAYDRAGGPDALKPVMLSIDTGPIRARRILHRMIDAEGTPVTLSLPDPGLTRQRRRRGRR